MKRSSLAFGVLVGLLAAVVMGATWNDSALIELMFNGKRTPFVVENATIQAIQGTTGGLNFAAKEASVTLTGASTDIDINLPSGALVIGCQLRVDTLITSGTAASWAAAFKTGSTTALATGQAFTKNTKVNKFIDVNAGVAVLTDVTDITITPNTGTFTAGVVRAICYYDAFTAMADAS